MDRRVRILGLLLSWVMVPVLVLRPVAVYAHNGELHSAWRSTAKGTCHPAVPDVRWVQEGKLLKKEKGTAPKDKVLEAGPEKVLARISCPVLCASFQPAFRRSCLKTVLRI